MLNFTQFAVFALHVCSLTHSAFHLTVAAGGCHGISNVTSMDALLGVAIQRDRAWELTLQLSITFHNFPLKHHEAMLRASD